MTETTTPARTNPKAWVSLLLGLLSPPTFGATGIFAFFIGLAALRQINRSDGAQKGARAAIGGMLLGVAGIVLFFLGLGVIGLDAAVAAIGQHRQQDIASHPVAEQLASLLFQRGAFTAGNTSAPALTARTWSSGPLSTADTSSRIHRASLVTITSATREKLSVAATSIQRRDTEVTCSTSRSI